MAEEDLTSPDSNRFDIVQMLQYQGESFRQQNAITDGLTFIDYRNSDQNEHNISCLLSSQAIPFHIERPKLGWSGTQIRMLLTVPRSQKAIAKKILDTGVSKGVIEIVEGMEGFTSY